VGVDAVAGGLGEELCAEASAIRRKAETEHGLFESGAKVIKGNTEHEGYCRREVS
jgi:hypothetical protein